MVIIAGPAGIRHRVRHPGGGGLPRSVRHPAFPERTVSLERCLSSIAYMRDTVLFVASAPLSQRLAVVRWDHV